MLVRLFSYLLFPLIAAAVYSETVEEKISHLEEQLENLQKGGYPYGNPSYFPCQNSWQVELSGDFLLWKAFEEGLTFAIKDRFAQTGSTSFPQGGDLINFSAKFAPGFRLSIDYSPHVDLKGVWTYFLSNSGFSSDLSLSPQGVGLVPLWLPPSQQTNLYSEANMHWRLNFNTVDFQLGKSYFVTPSLTMRPYISGRAAFIHQKIRAQYVSSTEPVINAKAIAKNNYWGVGPLLGFSSQWFFLSNWSFILSSSGSLLYGEFSTRYQNLGEIENHDLSENSKTILPNFSIFSALSWGSCFRRDRFYLSFQVGYELQYWWRQNQLRQFTDSLIISRNIKGQKDLSLHGLTGKIVFEF